MKRARTITIAKKEFIQIWRDPWSLSIAILLPVVMLFLYGYGISYDIKNLITAVYDLDKSQESREILGSFEHSGYFQLNYYLNHSNQIRYLFDRGKINLALWFPPGFAQDLKSGKTAILYIMVDGSDANTGIIALGYANAIVQSYSNRVMVQRLPAQAKLLLAGIPPIDDRIRVWYNPELKSINYLVPGLFAVIMMTLSSLLTSMTVVREKERGTIEQLLVSPLKPVELIRGKLIPYALISFLDIIIILLISVYWFKVPIAGNLVLFFILTQFFLITALSAGLFISAVSSTQSAAMLIAILGTMLPTFLLSGFSFPIESMPKFIQPITYLIPARYYLVIIRGIFLKGVGFELLWKDTLILIMFSIVFLTLASRKFKKKLD